MTRMLTAIIEREGDGYVALPEADVVSQGDTVTRARDNLEEALKLFFEAASQEERPPRRAIGRRPSCRVRSRSSSLPALLRSRRG